MDRRRCARALDKPAADQVRLTAAEEIVPGVDAHFVEGHELEPDLAERIPAAAIGRLMTAADAVKLIGRLDRIPKNADPLPNRRGHRDREMALNLTSRLAVFRYCASCSLRLALT
jgi:hypothetical protein